MNFTYTSSAHLNASEAFSSQVNNFSKISQIMQIDEYKLQQFYHC